MNWIGPRHFSHFQVQYQVSRQVSHTSAPMFMSLPAVENFSSYSYYPWCLGLPVNDKSTRGHWNTGHQRSHVAQVIAINRSAFCKWARFWNVWLAVDVMLRRLTESQSSMSELRQWWINSTFSYSLVLLMVFVICNWKRANTDRTCTHRLLWLSLTSC